MDVKTLIRNISMIVGIAAVAAVGLFFILFADLYLKAESPELFLGIFFPLASVVLLVLSESFKHKPVVFYVMKIGAVVLAIAFIIYAFYFMGTARFEGHTFYKLFKTFNGKTVFFLSSNFNDGIDIEFNKLPIYIIMIVFSIIGVIGQAVNVVFNKLVGLD
jgi:hypothetical protein